MSLQVRSILGGLISGDWMVNIKVDKEVKNRVEGRRLIVSKEEKSSSLMRTGSLDRVTAESLITSMQQGDNSIQQIGINRK